MKISELITALEEKADLHGDVEVEIEWEAFVHAGIDAVNDGTRDEKNGPWFVLLEAGDELA